jgi:hypothetical protein
MKLSPSLNGSSVLTYLKGTVLKSSNKTLCLRKLDHQLYTIEHTSLKIKTKLGDIYIADK